MFFSYIWNTWIYMFGNPTLHSYIFKCVLSVQILFGASVCNTVENNETRVVWNLSHSLLRGVELLLGTAQVRTASRSALESVSSARCSV